MGTAGTICCRDFIQPRDRDRFGQRVSLIENYKIERGHMTLYTPLSWLTKISVLTELAM